MVALLAATSGALSRPPPNDDPRFTPDAENASRLEPRSRSPDAVWLPAMVLAVGYFTYLYRSFRGRRWRKTNTIEPSRV
jgi:hypothetical protein